MDENYSSDYDDPTPDWTLLSLIVICSIILILNAFCFFRDLKNSLITKKLETK